jgi:hypothetical protein
VSRDAFKLPKRRVGLADDEEDLYEFAPLAGERDREIAIGLADAERDLAELPTPERLRPTYELPEREAVAQYNRQRAAVRPPERERARAIAMELEQAPGFPFLSHGLDTATFGLDDEIVAAGLTGMSRAGLIDEPVDYRATQEALDEATAISGEEHPWQSRAGIGAGLVATLPLSEAVAPIQGTRTLATTARALAPRVATGAALGGVGGYLGADEDEELIGAGTGALTGALLTGIGSGSVSAGRALSAGRQGPIRTILGAGLEGAGYGVLATPGSSASPIIESPEMVRAARENAMTGGLFGTGIGTLASGFSRPARSFAGGAEDVASSPNLSSFNPPPRLDESALEFGLADEADALATTPSTLAELGVDPRVAVEQAREAQAREPMLRRLSEGIFRRNPAERRIASMGMTDRRNVRRAERGFGSPQGFVDALNEAGLAMPGSTYAVRDERARAALANQAATERLGGMHQLASGEMVSGAAMADRLDAIADDLSRGVPNPRQRQRIAALRDRAMDFRYGTSARPETLAEPVQPLGVVSRGERGQFQRPPLEDVEVTSLPPERDIPYEEFRGQMREETREAPLRGYLSGATVEPTIDQLVSRDVYGAMADERNDILRRVLGPEGYADYQRQNRIFRATQAVADSPYEAMNPADLRGAIGRAGREGLIAPALGYAREQLIGQYQDSALAALNEMGTTTQTQVVRRAAQMALDSPNLPPDVRSGLEMLLQNPNAENIGEIFAAAREASPDPNVMRAISVVEIPQRWPAIMRRFRQLATVDPEEARRFAANVDRAASVGSLATIGTMIRDDDEEIAAEIGRAARTPEVSERSDRARGLGTRLGITPREAAETVIDEEPSTGPVRSERARALGQRLMGRGGR